MEKFELQKTLSQLFKNAIKSQYFACESFGGIGLLQTISKSPTKITEKIPSCEVNELLILLRIM